MVAFEKVPHVVSGALSMMHRHHDGGAAERAVAGREYVGVPGLHGVPLGANPIRQHHAGGFELVADPTLTNRCDHRAAENLVLAALHFNRPAAPIRVGLAEGGLHASERHLIAAWDHRDLLGMVDELDVFLDRVM